MTLRGSFALTVALLLVANAAVAAPPESKKLSDYVRPLVGTKGEGNTYPGPSAPFGMLQLSPDTDKELWETASGYEYSDPTIFGFQPYPSHAGREFPISVISFLSHKLANPG